LTTAFKAEKSLWTEEDFGQMCWHDNRLWSQAFYLDDYIYAIDIDYIVKWVQPDSGENYFSFWVSPATMCFENAFDIDSQIRIAGVYELEISELRQVALGLTPNRQFRQYRYEFALLHGGSISLHATGFKLYIRQPPRHTTAQWLSIEERGGISFDRAPHAI
jgi:hypothetical protein